MSNRQHFPQGTTWEQVRNTFEELQKQGLPGAGDVIETLDQMALNGNPRLEFEREVLDVFRGRLEDVLSGTTEREMEEVE